MIRLIKKLFPYLLSHERRSYRYMLGEDAVTDIIASIFSRSGKLLGEPDFRGSFTGARSFEMSVNSGAVTTGNMPYASVLYGAIEAVGTGTIIQTTIIIRSPMKFIALLLPLIGFIYLYQAIVHFSWQVCILAAGFIFLAPFICNWIAGILNGVILDRYEDYIDRAIRKAVAGAAR